MITDLIQQISAYSKAHKPKPFFTFNDKMNIELLDDQVKMMNKVGIGGFFIHARSGLINEYLSNDWFDIVRTCIQSANKYNLDVYIYDEHGWPSGFAGGKHLANKRDYWVKWLQYEKINDIEELKSIDNILGIYGVDEKNTVHFITDSNYTYPLIYVVYYVTNSGYIDVLNEEAVESFMKSTYYEYHKRFSNKFKGFFTDEPLYGDRNNPWNFKLNQRFLEKFGYNLLDKLISLFIDIDEYRKIRYDYFTLVNEMFNTAYFKQLFDFCEQHGYELTGHGIEEATPSLQVKCSADLMSKYEYMTIPGMDWLGKNIGSPVLPKQVSSIAVQLSKKSTISEMYALAGWGSSLSELKRIADWQYVHGITNICYILQHSMRGIRKRDYPSGYVLQQPYFKISQEFNKTFANLGAIVQEGKETCNVLLLLPVESVYTEYDGQINEKTKKIDDSYIKLSSALSQSHIPYHIGNENIMKEHGKIKDDRLHIGVVDYGYVILPTMTTIKRSTLDLLNTT